MNICAGVKLEKCQALRDAWNIMQMYGDEVKFQLRKESEVVRDKYNSIKTPDAVVDYTFKCYPITSNPTQDQMNKAGIFQKVDCLIYSAKKDWIDNGISLDNLDTLRSDIIWNGITWVLKEKNEINQIADEFIYIVMGLVKK